MKALGCGHAGRLARLGAAAGVGACGLFCAAAGGQVVLDGSLGPAGTLVGPRVIVPAELGTTAGSNLFHSFSRFDVASGTSVEFQGPDSIQNVLARVTGGSPSAIDGRIICAIPGADLYLVNPAGVMFGPGAALEVRGSFAVTSADYIRLGTGDAKFDARAPGASVLATSPPAAFGFLGAPGAIALDRTGLGVQTGQSVSLVGGDVRITGGQLLSASGTINLVAAGAGAGEATLDLTSQARS